MLCWAVYTICLRWRPRGALFTCVHRRRGGDRRRRCCSRSSRGITSGGSRTQWNPATCRRVAYFAIFPSVLAYFFWNAAVARVGGERAGTFIHLMPRLRRAARCDLSRRGAPLVSLRRRGAHLRRYLRSVAFGAARVEAARPWRSRFSAARPRGASRRPPLLFVHGAFAGAWCWDEYFLPWFSARGYAAHAVSLRGHGGSAARGPLWIASSLDDYVADTVAAAAQLDAPPVLIGHSMGAIVVQRAARACNARRHGAARAGASAWPGLEHLVACDARPAALSRARDDAARRRRRTRVRRVRDYLFSQSLSEADAHALSHAHAARIAARAHGSRPGRSSAWIASSVGVPALVLGAERDAFFTRGDDRRDSASSTAFRPRSSPGWRTSMMLEPGWRDVAEHVCAWLDATMQPAGE